MFSGSLQRRQLVLLALAFVAALLVTGMFAVRAAREVSRLGPGVDDPIRPWMNVPHIARSYRVPPPVLYQALGLSEGKPDRRPIVHIARDTGRPVDEMIADLQRAIVDFRAAHGSPPLPPKQPAPRPPTPEPAELP